MVIDMTIDEAIAHAREVANEQKRRSGICVQNNSECDKFSACLKCSEEHEQLAEWLEELKEYQQLEEQGRLVKLPYNSNYSEKEDSALSKFVATMIYYESLNNRLAKVFGKSDGLLEELVKAFEDASTLNVPKDTFKSVLLTNEDVDKYEEYEQLEEQGRLLKLPCKVGDTVYLIKNSETIVEREADMMFIGVLWKEFGKEWFLTKSEAEAKLKELRGGEE